MRRHGTAVFSELFHNDIGKCVLYQTLCDLTARCHNAKGFFLERIQLNERLLARRFFCPLHFFLFNDQRDDARAAQLLAFFDDKAGGSRGNHHFAKTVDAAQAVQINHEQAIYVRNQLHFSLFGFRSVHMLALTNGAQNIRRIVLVQHIFVVFPDVNMLFSHTEQNGNVLFLDNMSLAEHGIFRHALDNLRDVMTQHLSDCIFGSYQLHVCSPSCSSIGKNCCNCCCA